MYLKVWSPFQPSPQKVILYPGKSWCLFLKQTSTLTPFVACHPHMMTLKSPSSSPICSSKSLKFHNYGKAPYLVSSYCQSPHVNLFDRLFTWCSQSKLTRHVSIKTPTNTLLGVFQIQHPIFGVNLSNGSVILKFSQ